MIDPVARAGTASKVLDTAPCGGVFKGCSHSLVDAGTLHPLTWTVYHASEGANCTIRLLQSNATSVPLELYNFKADPDGWFSCGRKETQYETKTVVIPSNAKCTDCTLQFIFKTYQGAFYQCADIQITPPTSQTCEGKCHNGGVCDGNICTCKSSYYGIYCDYKEENEEHSSLGLFLAFLLLLIITSILIAILYYWKNPDSIPKVCLDVMQRFGHNRLEDENANENDKQRHEPLARPEVISIQVRNP